MIHQRSIPAPLHQLPHGCGKKKSPNTQISVEGLRSDHGSYGDVECPRRAPPTFPHLSPRGTHFSRPRRPRVGGSRLGDPLLPDMQTRRRVFAGGYRGREGGP